MCVTCLLGIHLCDAQRLKHFHQLCRRLLPVKSDEAIFELRSYRAGWVPVVVWWARASARRSECAGRGAGAGGAPRWAALGGETARGTLGGARGAGRGSEPHAGAASARSCARARHTGLRARSCARAHRRAAVSERVCAQRALSPHTQPLSGEERRPHHLRKRTCALVNAGRRGLPGDREPRAGARARHNGPAFFKISKNFDFQKETVTKNNCHF